MEIPMFDKKMPAMKEHVPLLCQISKKSENNVKIREKTFGPSP
jgi:hypothetical protein